MRVQTFASLHSLPVIFVCENNLYSVYTPHRSAPAEPSIDRPCKGARHCTLCTVTANRPGRMLSVISRGGRTRAQRSGGPTFLVLDTYRWREHCGPAFDNHIGYRAEERIQGLGAACPIRSILRTALAQALDSKLENAMSAEIVAEIEDARAFARATPLPDPSQASRHVYA